MELPLRVEVSKFSHIHIIQVLLPFVPGSVLSVGLTLGNSWMTTQFSAAQLGYRTKLFLAVALTYLLGLAFMTATHTCTDVVMGKLRRSTKALPWDNPYWRRVATAYVGKDLLPTTLLSQEEMTAALEYIVAMTRGKVDLESLKSSLEQAAVIEKEFSKMEELIENARKANPEKAKEVLDPLAGDLERRRQAVGKIKEVVADGQVKLAGLAVQKEWQSLHLALDCIPSDTENPYTSFVSLAAAMQSAGISGIWIMLRYPQLRTYTGMAFGALLTVVATYSLWAVFRLNRVLREMNTFQTATMLAELRKTPAEKA